MKRLATLLTLCFAFATSSWLFAGGGPDAYGYVWLNSNDVGGPTYNWIDITTVGTQVSGLADDNSVVPVNIGFGFHYYWMDFTKIMLGSNGWLGFDLTSNIASCFPTIPQSGGAGDNFLAPLLSDLIFTGVGNPAQAYTWTNNVDTFIISYLNVPFWQSLSPGYYGSNTFQVILSGVDSSITFQYASMNTTINSGCVTNLVGGIESPTALTGLQTFANANPPSNYAIKFYYPDSVLASISDVRADWNQNMDNKGYFLGLGSTMLDCNVENVGNTTLTTPTTVNTEVRDLFTNLIYSGNGTVTTMNPGDDSLFNFGPATFTSTGQYSHTLTVSNTADIAPTNDAIETEIDIVNLQQPSATLSYVEGNTQTGTWSWAAGDSADGLAIYIVPPVYPATISSLEYYITTTGNAFGAKILDDNGTFGLPGTVLYDSSMTPTGTGWNVITLANPITITSGGFYVEWNMFGGASVGLGTTTNTPISRQSYEKVDGAYAAYRSATTDDLMIRANITGYACTPAAAFNAVDNQLSVAFTDLSTGATSWAWDFGDGNTSTQQNPNHTYASSGTYVACLIATNACGSDTLCDSVTVCAATVAAFTDSIVGLDAWFTDQSTNATAWAWDFGDGTFSTQQNPNHTYASDGYYTVCLVTSNTCGSDTTCMDSVFICLPPTAGFSYIDQGQGLVDFTSSSTGTGQTWSWDFGDGNTSTQENPTHTYLTGGTYTVCLTVTGACGADTICDSLSVFVDALEDELAASLQLYPNPSNGSFILKGQTPGISELELGLYDLRGKLLRTVNAGTVQGEFETKIDLQDVSEGVYMLKVRAGNVETTRKLIIRN